MPHARHPSEEVKKIRMRYRVTGQYKVSQWKVQEMANCRKGAGGVVIMLDLVLSHKETARRG